MAQDALWAVDVCISVQNDLLRITNRRMHGSAPRPSCHAHFFMPLFPIPENVKFPLNIQYF
jgi:hypothetical protein